MVHLQREPVFDLANQVFKQVLDDFDWRPNMPDDVSRQIFFRRDNLWRHALSVLVVPLINDYYPSWQLVAQEWMGHSAHALSRSIHERMLLLEYLYDHNEQLVAWVRHDMLREYWFTEEFMEDPYKTEDYTEELQTLAEQRRILDTLLGEDVGSKPPPNQPFKTLRTLFDAATTSLPTPLIKQMRRWMIRQPSVYVHGGLTIAMTPQQLERYVRFSVFQCQWRAIGICQDNGLLRAGADEQAREVIKLCEDVMAPYRLPTP